ncbi:hypothetical protein Pan97_23790 [Bremerella volcania]|uniref:Uncharacterized protein n=1 Tax=Bremerella volcania TaxID=2527984 RepID=A0A518C805_9BACT|nr:hypothetical protein [Bremerella volcania]QDU75349.1 hypothetical protein Pan97_23790 [Bremerella volcania]
MTTFLYWLGIIVAVILGFAIGALVFGFEPVDGADNYFWVVVAGGFGGIIHGLIDDGGSGKFRLPRSVTTQDNDVVADIGIFGEMLIGMLGAMISVLVIAVFLGTDPFTEEDPDVSLFRLIGFGALAGFAARQFLPNLSKRFSSLIESKIETMADAAKAEQARQAEVIAEGQRARAEIVRLAGQTSRLSLEAMRGQGATNFDSMETLVAELAGITLQTHPEYKERVRAMMDLADRMVEGVPADTATKQNIAGRIGSADNKAWLVPLSTLIARSPEDGDAQRLLDAYDAALSDPEIRKKSKFILYRILLAIIALVDSVRLPISQVPRARAVAQACLAIDDASLKKRAAVVLAMLE